MNPKYFQVLACEEATSYGVTVYVYRLDLVHQRYSGNKDYKLRYLNGDGYQQIVSFGGIWSNHLLALSHYGVDRDIQTVAIVRNPTQVTTTLLERCVANGMHVKNVSYSEYRDRNKTDYLDALRRQYENALLLPEGGAGDHAIRGCEDIGKEILAFDQSISHVVTAVGTGQTMAGIRRALPLTVRVEGEAITKKFHEQNALISCATDSMDESHWQLFHSDGVGDYGKLSAELTQFMLNFESKHDMLLDPNYSAKAFYGFYKRLHKGLYQEGSKVVLVHTGGVIGRDGYNIPPL